MAFCPFAYYFAFTSADFQFCSVSSLRAVWTEHLLARHRPDWSFFHATLVAVADFFCLARRLLDSRFSGYAARGFFLAARRWSVKAFARGGGDTLVYPMALAGGCLLQSFRGAKYGSVSVVLSKRAVSSA
jgi:hypothetical protein